MRPSDLFLIFCGFPFAAKVAAIREEIRRVKEEKDEFMREKQKEIDDFNAKTAASQKRYQAYKAEIPKTEKLCENLRSERAKYLESIAVYEDLFKKFGIDIDKQTCPG